MIRSCLIDDFLGWISRQIRPGWEAEGMLAA
jgi:hypothetical protein